jgi:CMP-N,N'-diacetyllegionaminic acid synthase
MFHDKTVYAIIPARAGSKRLPGKNLLEIEGLTLTERAIICAKKCTFIDQVILSSEADEIISLVKNDNSVKVHKRNTNLASDLVRTYDVVADILISFGIQNGWILLLQPTSPFRTSADVEEFFIHLDKQDLGFDSAASVNILESTHPNKVQKINNGKLISFMGTDSSVPDQSLDDVFELNGAFYLTDVESLQKQKTFLTANCVPYVMPKIKSLNLNNNFDFEVMKFLMQKNMIEFD